MPAPIEDANGNFLSDNVDTTTQFNGNNMLVGYNAPGEQASYVYDGLGDRVEKTVDGATSYYFRNALGQVTSELTGSTWTDFVTTAEGDRVVALTGSNEYFLHYGPLGTLRAITNSSGNNLLSCGQNSSYPQGSMLTYAPFGKETGGCGQSTIAFKFAGYERDSGSGWDNAQARMYASNIARFLSPDPAGLAAANPANPQTWDGYTYVGNAPLSFVDPDGLAPANPPTPPGSGTNPPGVTCTLDSLAVPCGYVFGQAAIGLFAECPNNNCFNAGATYYSPVNFLPYVLETTADGWQFQAQNGEMAPAQGGWAELNLPDFNFMPFPYASVSQLPPGFRITEPTSTPRVSLRPPPAPTAKISNPVRYPRDYGAFLGCEYGEVMGNPHEAKLTATINFAPLILLSWGNVPGAARALGVMALYDIGGAWTVNTLCSNAVYGPQ